MRTLRTPISVTEGRRPFVSSVALRRDEVPDFEKYPFNLPVVRGLHTLALHPKVTFLIGENGAGKSTLLEAIAVAWGFNAEGGSKNFHFATRKSHSALSDYLTLRRSGARASDGFFLRAESFYNVATQVEELDVTGYGPTSLHEMSHGESFLAIFTHRFWGEGLYLMDEPESALSPMRQMSLLRRMHELVSNGSQFIIATHSPILMAYPDAQILLCSEEGVTETTYEETEHVFITREFVNRRERMLTTLLGDGEPRD